MSELDDNISVEFPTGSDCKTQYMQCKACKQVKCVDEFVSKHYAKVYNKTCRACLDHNKNLGLKGRNDHGGFSYGMVLKKNT